MNSKEELANMPLSFFENNPDKLPQDQGMIDDIKLLAMEQVQIVFVEPGELPEIILR